jgi:hypothetical protein
VDELRQRLDRPENQSRLADQQAQLEQTRRDVQRAAEATEQGQVSQALASGTRAQRQMQQLGDDLRRQNASAFAEDLRQLRGEARDLSRRQEEIEKQIDALNRPQRPSLSDAGLTSETQKLLARQRERLTNLVERAADLSRQSEEAEPLMSRELYDAVRAHAQADLETMKRFQEELINRGLMTRDLYDRLREVTDQSGAKSLDLTAELLRQGYLVQADQAEERARNDVENLRRGVERAAERVLGDDTEALRLARDQLGNLTEELERELAQAETGQTNPPALARADAPVPAPGAPPTAPSEDERPDSDQPSPAERGANQGGQAARTDERAQPPGPDAPVGDGARQRPGQGDGPTPNAPGPRTASDPTGRDDDRREPSTPTGGRRGVTRPDLDRWLEARGGTVRGGPITGEDFGPWSDGLREVEQLVDEPAWRNDLARARERARQIRQDYRRKEKKPDWAVLRLEVVRPLVEVGTRIAEELARREPNSELVPIDRDPVPARFSELVRRYYETLGKDPGTPAAPPPPRAN